MVRRIVIGDMQEMQARKEEISEYQKYLNNIADKSLAELNDWFNQKFTGFTQDQQDGLWVLFKTQWANARCMKKLIKTVENV